jgi:hypothetical protein
MSCESNVDQLVAHLESALSPEEDRAVLAHLETCGSCRATLNDYRRVRDRILVSARSAATSALEGCVMSTIASGGQAAGPTGGTFARLTGALLWGRPRRLGFGIAGFALLVVAVAAVFLGQPSHAWSIEQSIQATRPFEALHLRATLGGSIRCELWARSAASPSRRARLLIRSESGWMVWTEGNTTHYYDPNTRVVQIDDAQTAGFNPWPGTKLFELARAAGVRVVDTRWRFPHRRSVVTEWSFVTANGPTSARAEFDLETKLLIGLRQWDNMDRRGVPGVETDDITYLSNLPDAAFSVDLPPGVTSRPKDVEVKESLLGLLALEDTGIETPGVSPEEAARRIATDLWHAIIDRDIDGLRRLCPVTRGASDAVLSAMVFGTKDDPEGVLELVDVEPGVLRGHSRLGPLTVVTTRVRQRDGALYEEKFIVQHRLTGTVPSCAIYAPYGTRYLLQ